MSFNTIFNNPFALFDFDGTIVDSNGEVIRQMRLFMEREHLSADADFIERAKTMSPPVLAQTFSHMSGGRYSPKDVGAHFDDVMRRFYLDEVQLKHGVSTYIERLHKAGVRLAIASCSGEYEITHALTRLGLFQHFEFIATPAVTGVNGKFDPAFFVAAARMFPAAANLVTVYDDAYDALAAAKQAGMSTVAVYDDDNDARTEELIALCDGYLASYSEHLPLHGAQLKFLIS